LDSEQAGGEKMLKTIDPLLDADVLEDLGAGGRGDRPAMRETCCRDRNKQALPRWPLLGRQRPSRRTKGADPVFPISNSPRLHMLDMLAG
jgi:hypothetical protein